MWICCTAYRTRNQQQVHKRSNVRSLGHMEVRTLSLNTLFSVSDSQKYAYCRSSQCVSRLSESQEMFRPSSSYKPTHQYFDTVVRSKDHPDLLSPAPITLRSLPYCNFFGRLWRGKYSERLIDICALITLYVLYKFTTYSNKICGATYRVSRSRVLLTYCQVDVSFLRRSPAACKS